MLWMMLIGELAFAQAEGTAEQVHPAATVAAEDSAYALYVNPANLAYDPDLRWGLSLQRGAGADTRLATVATLGAGPGSIGTRWWGLGPQGNVFSIDAGVGIPLPERFSIGLGGHWMILEEGTNHVTFDVAASFRPLSWLGISAVSRNVGTSTEHLSLPESAFGFAFRPLGPSVLVGTEALYRPRGERDGWAGRLSLRVRPLQGWFIRAAIDTDLRLQAAVEFAFGGVATGASVGFPDYAQVPATSLYATTESRQEHVAARRSLVEKVFLTSSPPSIARKPLLGPKPESWTDLQARLRRVQRSAAYSGVILTLGGQSMSWARWSELHEQILATRQAGKTVVAYLTSTPGNGAVMAASAADEVWVHPASTLDLVGPHADLVYLGGMLDAVGIDVQVARRSEYKTASEPLTDATPSPAQIEQRQRLLDVTAEELVARLAQGRHVPPDVAGAWLDEGPWTAESARRRGLVDRVLWPDQLQGAARDTFPRSRIISQEGKPPGKSPWEPERIIAVVHIRGTIVPGSSSPPGLLSSGNTGSTTIVRLLDDLATDPRIRAVVLRVDSPGGSVFASEEILRAVRHLRHEGMPVVASMAGVAASGGYYVSLGAEEIYAEPTTITGSIGVITTKVALGRIAERLGVSITPLASSRVSGLDSPWSTWDPHQRAQAERMVSYHYTQFKRHVAQARHLTEEQTESAARGRVWSGTDAQRLGLVDTLGGLQAAVDRAADLAGIPSGVGYTAVDMDGIDAGPLDLALPELPSLGVLDPSLSWITPVLIRPDTTWMLTPWSLSAETR